MKRRSFSALALASLLAAGQPALAAERLQAFTENLPPLNHQGPEGPEGFSVELLRLVAEQAGLPLDIEVLPWARAQLMAEATPNSLLFSLTRLPEREAHFSWVGPISPRRILIYRLSRRSEVQLTALSQPGPLRVGVVRDSAAHLQLTAAGLGEDKLELSQDDASNLRKLLAGRMDAIVLLDWAAAWNLREQGLPYDTLAPLLELDARYDYWFGLRADSDPMLQGRRQKALDAIRADGRYESLRKRYFR